MKLAFCLFKYFPYGGLQRDFMRIAKECVRRGHQVIIYTMAWEGEPEPDFRINILPIKGRQNHTRIKRFAEETRLQAKGYDLIVGFNKMPGLDVYYAADTCYQAKARKQHTFWYRLTPRYRQLIAAETAVFSSQAQTDILLLSPSQQNEFIQFYSTQAKRFHLLPPGIAYDRMAPKNAIDLRRLKRKELCLQDNAFLLLFIGSGFKTKGLDRALLAFSALPQTLRESSYLYIVGKDHTRFFQQQAKKLNIAERIHFLGGRDDISQLLLAGDLLLHPAYHENTGTVLLEALAAGLPVLTTDVCGYAHYIQEANAGIVITSPFQQSQLNAILAQTMSSSARTQWKENALAFSQIADIYQMPIHAVDLLESFKNTPGTG